MKNKLRRIISFSIAILLSFTSVNIQNNIQAYAAVSSINPIEWTFNPQNSVVSWVVPKTGTYEIEISGGSGAGIAGGYISGRAQLTKDTTYYIAVGGNGSASASGAPGGWNGGGSSSTYGGSGGGATCIYTALYGDGQLVHYEEHTDDIVLVAGGGGGLYYSSETQVSTYKTINWADNPSSFGVNGLNESDVLKYHRVGYTSGTWYDLEESSRFGKRYEEGYGIRCNTFYKTEYDLNHTWAVGNGGTAETGAYAPRGSAYTSNTAVMSGYNTAGQNASGFVFGKGEDANPTYKNGYTGAGGGGLHGGKSVNTNSYRCSVGGGGSGYIKSGFFNGNIAQSLGGGGRVYIKYIPEEVSLTINTYGYGGLNGNTSDINVTKDSEMTEDLSSFTGKPNYTFRRFIKLVGDGVIDSNNIFTFGHVDTDYDAIFQTDFSVSTKRFGELNDILYITAKEDDNMSKKFIIERSVDNTAYTTVLDNEQNFFSQENGSYLYNGSAQEYTVPIDGWYKLHCIGSGGTGAAKQPSPGSEAYGTYYLKEGTKLYIYVGARMDNFNGGGNGTSRGHYNVTIASSKGCGATDIRLIKSTASDGWSGNESLLSRLVTAGGGAGYCVCAGRSFNGGTALNQAWDSTGACWGSLGANSWWSGPSSNGTLGQGSNSAVGSCSLYSGDHALGVSGGGGGGWYGGRTESKSASTSYDNWPAWNSAARSLYYGENSINANANCYPYLSINGNRMSGCQTKAHAGTSNVQSGYTYNGVTYTPNSYSISNFNSTSNGRATIKYVNNDDAALAYNGTFDIGDKKAPEVPDLAAEYDSTQFNIIFNEVQDFGNTYKFRLTCLDAVDNTQFGSHETPIYENISGVKGYYYYFDNMETGTVTTSNTFTETGFSVPTSYDGKYLHVATIDKAGNLSDTVTIQLIKGVVIKFNANTTGYTNTMENQLIQYNTTDNLHENSFKKKGYLFVEWNTKPDATGDTFADKKEVSYQDLVTKYGFTVNLYAQWKPIEYDIYYEKGITDNGGGGTTNKTTHNYDSNVTLASNGFTGTSYSINFDANKPSNATGTVANMPSNITGNLQFDKWSVSATNNSGEYSANTNIGVKNFESTNGATAHATALWKKSYYYEKKQPTLKDWEFVGWSTDKNATSGDLIAAEDILPSTSAFNKTLYAIWKPAEYKITYSANGATNVPSTQTKKADTSIKLSSLVPEREFYRFIEWNTNADGTGTAYQPNQTYSTNADLTLYAIFDYNKDDIYYYKGLTNDTTHTDIIKATRNSNIQSNSLITQPYTQWVMNNNILIAGIGTVKGREYKVNFDYNIPVSATNEQKDTVIISGYTNDASGKTTYKVNDYLKFNKWSLTGSKLLPPTIEPEQTYKPVYKKHVHSGSSSTGGGCYTIRQQRTDSYTTTCGCASCWCEGFNGISDNWNCVHCGHGHNGPHGDGNGTGNGRCTATKRKYYTVVYYELGCGKTEGVRYQDEGIDYYAIDANPNYTGPFGTEATNKIATALWKNVTFGNFKTPTMDGWEFMGWYDNQAGNNSTAVSTVLKTKDTDYYTNKINTTIDKSANSNVKVYGDLTEYTVEPSTGIFEKTLYARWQRTITLTFNMNNGQYQGSSDDVVLTGVYYNNADGYNFSLTSVPTAASLPDYEKQQNYIDAYGVYNSNGENSKYIYYNELTETTYRFLGWSLDPNATEPDSDLIVFDSGHKTSYRIYDDTTLYAVWEPVLITNLTLKRTLGNLSFSDGTLPNSEANNIRCSDGQQLVEVIAKPGEQCYYTITTKGKNGINAGVRFDNEILNIYANDGIWKDNLNPNTGTGEEQLTYCGLDRNFTITENYLMRKFYIPQYLGTKNSYPSSKGKTQYQVIFEIAQSSYFYNYVYHKNEQVEVVGTIYITTQAPGGGGGIITPTPNPPIISVLDELRTKLKIRLH